MTDRSRHDFEAQLQRRLRGARRIAVVGIGDELNPHDWLGMQAARDVQGLRLPSVRVFLAGTVPEAVTGPLRRYRPDHILLLDAADLGARAGTVAIVQPRAVHARLFSTHALPLSVVMEFLERDTKARVTLVGIQPDTASRRGSPSAREQAGLTRILTNVYRIAGRAPRRQAVAVARRSRASEPSKTV